MPLLPRSLQSRWQQDPLPSWVIAEIGLDSEATMDELGKDVWDNMQSLGPRLRSFLLFTVKSRRSEIRDIVCVDRTWPAGLRISDVGWTARTRNALARLGMLKDKHALTDLTFRKLATVRGLGAAGIVDFAATLEAAMDHHEELTAEYVRSANVGLGLALRELHDKAWADQISNEDMRFAHLLPQGEGTVRERVEALLLELDPGSRVDEGPLLLGVTTEIENRVAEIGCLPLEQALLSFLRILTKDETGERSEVLAARLGWAGAKPLTLKECSEKLGITRERVRQLQMQATSRIPRHEVLMPQLDRALAVLEENAPIGFEQASLLLHDAGLTAGKFHIPSLLDIAKLLRKQTSLKSKLSAVEGVLVRDEDAEMVSRVLPIGRKLVGRSGVSSIFQVQDALDALGYQITEDSLKRVLEGIPETCQFLDDMWFVINDIPADRDRLRNTVRKMLAVTSPQKLGSLREGVRRAFRGRGISYSGSHPPVAPPAYILRLYLERSSEFALYGDDVSPTRALDYRQELGENEHLMVDALRSSPTGVLDRRSLAEGCIARGMNENTFNVYTSYSSIVEHIGTDLWKLRGAEVDPAAVEAVRSANKLRTKERRVFGFEWAEDGKLRLAFRVGGRAADSAVFGCPSTIQRFLADSKFECQVKGTRQTCGKVGMAKQGTIYGFKPFIQRYGLDENDVLLAEFDINSHVVLLSIGYDELLDDVE